jgi:hypothetical protein
MKQLKAGKENLDIPASIFVSVFLFYAINLEVTLESSKDRMF